MDFVPFMVIFTHVNILYIEVYIYVYLLFFILGTSGADVDGSMARLSLSPSQAVGGARAKDGPSSSRFMEGDEVESPSWEDDYKAWEEKCAVGKHRKKRVPACTLETTSSGVEGDEFALLSRTVIKKLTITKYAFSSLG